jgi:hypothetical protein
MNRTNIMLLCFWTCPSSCFLFKTQCFVDLILAPAAFGTHQLGSIDGFSPYPRRLCVWTLSIILFFI